MKPQTVNDLSIDIAVIQTARDIAKLDASCIDEKNLPASLYDAVSQASENFPNDIAIKYILDGDCLSQDQIPFSKKVIHHIFRVFKNSNVANPYREITYRNLAEQVTQLANGLRSLGIQKHDVTSLVMPNFPEAYISLWGAATAGIVSPINPMLDSSIIREIMLASKAKVIIALGPVPGSDIWEKVLEIKDHIPNLRAVISVFGPSIPVGKNNKVQIISLMDLLSTQNREFLDFDPPSQQDTCAYFHTGGTTGLPKLAKHSHLNQLTNGAQVNLISPAEPGDTIFVGLPIFHVNAAVATGIAPIMNRSKILLASPAGYRGKNIISQLPDLIEGYQVSLMMAVPTVYSSLLLELEKNLLASEKLQSLKLAISGAAPLSSELKKQFISKSGVNLIEGYGLTESSSVCTLMPVKNINKKESVGLKIPGMTLKIISFSEQNNEVMECSNNQVGEIVINGNNVFSGYVENIHNENLFVEFEGCPYIRTGDLGSLDEHGYLSLAGRQKEIIIRGGHNIDPKMIEDIAYQHPLVSLAAAVPKPDTYAGEVPVLYVTPTSDSDKERLQKEITVFMKDRTPERAAIPKEVLVIGEMPLTAVGKIFKPKLVCDQITAVINAHLTDILKSEDYIVQTSPTKKRGIFSVIHLQAYLSKELVAKVEDKLTPFAFQYQIEIQNNNKSTHIEATTL